MKLQRFMDDEIPRVDGDTEVAAWFWKKPLPILREDILSQDEIRKSLQMTHPIRREQFLEGRTRIRVLFAKILGITPSNLEIGFASSGKPFIQNDEWDFSLSHSKHLGMLAFTRLGKIGADLDVNDERKYFQRLAKRFFAPEENPVRTWEEFIDLWTKKEAVSKIMKEPLLTQLNQSRHHGIIFESGNWERARYAVAFFPKR